MQYSKDSKLLLDAEQHLSSKPVPLPRKAGEPVRAAPKPGTALGRLPSSSQKACFLALCVYFLSGFANEFAFRLIHAKAYISTVALLALPVFFVATGRARSGLRATFGRWLLTFGVWLAICAPFSVWKSDTLNVLLNYYLRSFLLYFVICACVVSIRQLKTLMYVMALGNVLVLLSCLAFGTIQNGRFTVPNSIFSFLSNSNELGLQLLLGIIYFLFALLCARQLLVKIGATAGIALSVLYMLKTGSRGTFVAVLSVILAYFLVSQKKLKFAAIILPCALASLFLIPSEALHRLTYIAIGNNEVTVSSQEDASALESQRQRQQLFWDSVALTLQHPVFGIGPGEFPVADAHQSEQKGVMAMWRQPHNSYTQVSSEAGIPALIFYLCCLITCFRLNYRMHKETRRRPELKTHAAVSLCMLLCIVAYMIDTIFDQLAYFSYLPILGGITVALSVILQPTLQAANGDRL